ncbi:hypothetical protein SLS64_005358 [Diaporthe eres]|uniref:BRCT domain-containing protein n=1 Tax=Diaporthe eres TaxID=83184 RepID=A0ABR1PB90_DIAER
MEHHLDGVVVCICGDPRFDRDKNQHIRDQFTEENVSRWLKYRGGKLVEEVTKTTTHLICSRAAYSKKGNPKVKAARKYGCKIVTYEWLTDTFQLLDYHKKKAPPSLYHPGKPRDGDAISDLFKKSETKPKAVKKKKASPAAADTTAVKHDDDARAAEEVAETGMKHLAISEEKDSQKSSEEKKSPNPSEAGEGKDTKAIDDMKGASTSVSKESGKPTGKPEKSAKVKNKEPPVDLRLYNICKDESGLHQIEVSKPDRHGNERGCRLVLELYESKSEPKTYLFGATKYPVQGSGACATHFSSEASGDKKLEFQKYRSVFRQCTGVRWHQRDSIPSKGKYCYRSPIIPGNKIGSASHENKSKELGGGKGQATSHVADLRDRETSFKRKRSFSEERPAKAFKVTKPSIPGNSANVTKGGSKTE